MMEDNIEFSTSNRIECDVVSDTNQACFLCKKKSTSDFEIEFEYDIHSIRNIFQYLKLHLNQNHDFYNQHTPLPLCRSCIPVISKLSSLIRQLELTQMQIDYEIQRVHKIIQESSLENSGDVLTKANSSYNTGNQLVTQLRKKMQEKCTKEVNRIQNAGPKVNIERVILQNCGNFSLGTPTTINSDEYKIYTNPEPQSESSEDAQCFPKVEYDDDYQNEIEPSDDNYHSFSITTGNTDSLEYAEFTNRNAVRSKMSSLLTHKFLKHSNGKKHKCLMCSKTFQTATKHIKTCLQRHLILVHLEDIFEHVKLPQFTKDQFGIICRHVLSQLANKANTMPTSGRIGNFVCPFCSTSVSSRLCFRTHLVNLHSEKLIPHINKHQQTSNSDTISKLPKKGGPKMTVSHCENWIQYTKTREQLYSRLHTGSKFQCKLCQRIITTRANIHNHLIVRHPETAFENPKPLDYDEGKFSVICKHILKSQFKPEEHTKFMKCSICQVAIRDWGQIQHHIVSAHYTKLEEELSRFMESKDQSKVLGRICKPRNSDLLSRISKKYITKVTGTEEGNCAVCNAQLNMHVFKSHLLSVHPELVFGELKHQQNERRKGDIFNSRFKVICYKPLEPGVHTCAICGKPFGHIGRAKVHFVLNHPDVLFGTMQLSNVTKENFRFCCQELLKSELKESSGELKSDKRREFNCSYCSSPISTAGRFQYHLVAKHFENLEEKLVKLQMEEVWLGEQQVGQDMNITVSKKRRLLSEHSDKEMDTSAPVKLERGLDTEDEIVLDDEDVNEGSGFDEGLVDNPNEASSESEDIDDGNNSNASDVDSEAMNYEHTGLPMEMDEKVCWE